MKGRKLIGLLAAALVAVAFMLMISSLLARKEEWAAIEKYLSESKVISQRMATDSKWCLKPTPQRVAHNMDGSLCGSLQYSNGKKAVSVKWSRKTKDSPTLQLSISDITGSKKPELLEEVEIPVKVSSAR